MIQKITSLILGLMFFLPYFANSQSVETYFQNQLDALYKQNEDAIGVLMHIESPDENLSWTSAVGFSNLESKTTLEKNQPILIASNTKPYVAAAILRLVEMKKITLEQPIKNLINEELNTLFSEDGYDFNQITVRHLLSHTSGIADYVDSTYFDFVDQNPSYTWKKEEQIQRALKIGNPLFEKGTDFKYGDINYLLLTEIIEKITGEPFYLAMRKLLKFKELKLNHTWFKDLEPYPEGTEPMAHQYAKKYDWDSYKLNPSWDLYGGGGLATTVKEAALFFQYLFEGKIIEDQSVLSEIYQFVLPKEKSNYCLGIRNISFPTFTAYYHGGWWGTDVAYSPETNSSVAVFTLQKAKRVDFARLSIDFMKKLAEENAFFEDHIITPFYELYKAKNAQATLVLFPGGASTAKETKEEFKILTKAKENNISVVMMNFNRHLMIDENETGLLARQLEEIFSNNKLDTENIFIGGISIGGNVTLTLSNYLHRNKSLAAPKGVFIVDSPIDLYALYLSSIKDVNNPDFSEERLAEPKWIISYFEEKFGKQDTLLENIQKIAPFTSSVKNVNVQELKNCRLRFYTEPDAEWWIENRQTDFESTNAYIIQQIADQLKIKDWQQFELIETKNKGYRANGERHPHSWSIVDVNELIKWMLK